MLPMHLFLDRMWLPDERVSFLWPWAGHAFPPVYEEGLSGFWDHLMGNLCSPVNLSGELGGMLVLGYLWRWCGLSSAARRAQVWKTGLLAPVPGRTEACQSSLSPWERGALNWRSPPTQSRGTVTGALRGGCARPLPQHRLPPPRFPRGGSHLAPLPTSCRGREPPHSSLSPLPRAICPSELLQQVVI